MATDLRDRIVNRCLTAPSGVEDPFHFFAHLRVSTRNCSILESLGSDDAATSRYTFVGAIPLEELVCEAGRSWLLNVSGERTGVDWLSVLDEWSMLAPGGGAEPYQTGAIGYVSYDANPSREAREWQRPAEPNVAEVRLVRYGAVLVYDKTNSQAVWAYESECADTVLRLERRWGQWRDCPQPESHLALLGDIEPDFRVDDLRAKIERTIDYIRAGDVFQANITGRFSARYEGDLFAAYTELRSRTPNPFFAFLDFEQPVLSTSPERFFKVAGSRIESRPIKGTAPTTLKGKDQRGALLASTKDVAENTMIVDVVRNDLGRVCTRGSIVVEELCEAKRFNQLYHLESTVAGDLRNDATPSAVLGALCPAASITGAPKLRAVEVIDELESTRRSLYCGAIGFFGSLGWIDTSVAIRVVYTDGDRVHVHAGGGIVIDSVPDAECEELALKARTLLEVLQGFNVLEPLRRAIDDVDSALFEVLAERFRLVARVAELKTRFGIATLQQSRVTSMVRRREQEVRESGAVPVGLVGELYALLVGHAMAVEDEHQQSAADEDPSCNRSTPAPSIQLPSARGGCDIDLRSMHA